MKYLGIDGGGTKTSFCLTDESLNILSEYQTTGCYYPDVGKDGIVDIIKKGIEMCLIDTNTGADTDIKDIRACCGLPAYGELDGLMSDLPEIKSRIPVPVKFCNDVEVCHAGALGLNPGIAIISGTGSIAFGRDEAGKTARSGGFGCELGGDEGSAHFIGLKLVQKFTRQSDYREERTILYNEVKKALNLQNDFDICTYMIETIKLEREAVAKLALLAYSTAVMGDTVCRGIFSEAAHELYLLAAAVKKQLDFADFPVTVSYGGGVFKAGDMILPGLNDLLEKDGMVLAAPKYPPVIGACLLAGE